MKRLALTAAALLALTGCSTDDGTTSTPSQPGTEDGASTYTVMHVNVDGRDIPCITWKRYNAGGLSCDWNAR